MSVEWLSKGRKARCAPDPDYPDGKNLDLSLGATKSCKFDLPYPAPECGVFLIRCEDCGLTVGVTAAGRPDDPKSIRVTCKLS